jgi:hypothetical protein
MAVSKPSRKASRRRCMCPGLRAVRAISTITNAGQFVAVPGQMRTALTRLSWSSSPTPDTIALVMEERTLLRRSRPRSVGSPTFPQQKNWPLRFDLNSTIEGQLEATKRHGLAGSSPWSAQRRAGGREPIRDSAKFLAFTSCGSKWPYFDWKVVPIGRVRCEMARSKPSGAINLSNDLLRLSKPLKTPIEDRRGWALSAAHLMHDETDPL